MKQTPTSAVRGSTVRFVQQFRDADGNLYAPSQAVLTIIYTIAPGVSKTHDFVMDFDEATQEWVTLWDTRGAYAGLVSWSISAPNNEPPGDRYDGTIHLIANPANVQAEVDTPDVPPVITTDLTNPNNTGTASMLGVF